MKAFSFIDHVSEVIKGQSITAFFTLKGTEEFLLDHFEGFPVMPGVLLLESLRQASQELLERSGQAAGPCRFTEVQQVRFGQFVKPGNRIRLSVRLMARRDPLVDFEGQAHLANPDGSDGSRVLRASFTTAPRSV